MPDFHKLVEELKANRGPAQPDDEQKRAHEERLQLYRRRLRDSGLPDGWHKVSFDTFRLRGKNLQALTAIQESLQPGHHRGVFLRGDTGVGKTLLLAGLVRRLCSFTTPTYLNGNELASEIERQRFSEQSYVESLVGGILILDDLTFTNPPIAYVCDQINYLLDCVYATLRGPHPTKLYGATNLLAADMNRIFGPRFRRRLEECCPVSIMSNP